MTDDKTWTKNSNGFIKKPGKGWLHSDESIQDGITYNVKVEILFKLLKRLLFY